MASYEFRSGVTVDAVYYPMRADGAGFEKVKKWVESFGDIFYEHFEGSPSFYCRDSGQMVVYNEWIVRPSSGRYHVVPDERFQRIYTRAPAALDAMDNLSYWGAVVDAEDTHEQFCEIREGYRYGSVATAHMLSHLWNEYGGDGAEFVSAMYYLSGRGRELPAGALSKDQVERIIKKFNCEGIWKR